MALALLAGTGIAIYSWITSSLISFHRVQSTAIRTAAMRNALEWMNGINPAESQQGKMDSYDLTISWKSHPVAPMIDGYGYPRGVGLYQLGLFETEVVVSRLAKELARFTLRQVGYMQVRKPRTEL